MSCSRGRTERLASCGEVQANEHPHHLDRNERQDWGQLEAEIFNINFAYAAELLHK